MNPKDHSRASSETLSRARKTAQTAAIAVALVSLGSLAPSNDANAAAEILYSSRVDGTATPPIAGTTAFRYEFTVFNTSPSVSCPSGQCPPGTPVIVDWELPLFSDNDISKDSNGDFLIRSPSGWTYEIVKPDASTGIYNNPSSPYGQYRWNYSAAGDPDALAGNYGPNPQVFDNPPLIIHWYTTICSGECTQPDNPIYPDNDAGFIEFLAGFGFDSPYASQNAPYLSSWFFLPPRRGDPPIPPGAFATPNSPARQAAQNQVPEPGGLALAGLGLTLLAALRRRMR